MHPGLKRDTLLMLAPVMPSNRGNGLAMRAGFFLDAYSRQFDVDLIVAPVSGIAERSAFAQSRARRVDVLNVDHTDSHYGLVASVRDPMARLEAFRHYGRPSLAAAVGPACAKLKTLLGEIRYKVVHASRLYLAELAMTCISRADNETRILLDCDENDALVYRRLAAMERRRQNLMAAAWAEAEATAMARFAVVWLSKFDLVFAASQKEMNSLSALGARTALVPNVMYTTPARRSHRRRERLYTIVFVGTLGYAPNGDAAHWMVTRIWPRLSRVINSRLRLFLVGRDPSASLIRLGRRHDIRVTGTVPDVVKFYREADLVVVPIRAGGGTRIKLLEAAAWGIPIVSTTLGAEGTTFRHGRELLIADNAEQFARSCATLLRDEAYARRLAARARRRIVLEYDADCWARRVVQRVATLKVGVRD
jgi:glycosyltransferase involved in cell wall biosynthesis